MTRIDEGFVPASILLGLPGECGEHEVFAKSRFGSKTESEFRALAESLASGWRENAPILVCVEADGRATIYEGNHRLRAAEFAGIEAFVEVRYFGNSQERGLIHG